MKKNPMYLPEEEEMIEFYHYGFCPSNEIIVDCIETLSALLDIRKAKKAEYLRETLEEVENGIRNLEKKTDHLQRRKRGRHTVIYSQNISSKMKCGCLKETMI